MTVQGNERHRGGNFTDFFRVAKGILLNKAGGGPDPAGQGQVRRRRPRRAGHAVRVLDSPAVLPDQPVRQDIGALFGYLLGVSYTL
jgi:hypothetical protein